MAKFCTWEEYEGKLAKLPKRCAACIHLVKFESIKMIGCSKNMGFFDDCKAFVDKGRATSENAMKEPRFVRWESEYFLNQQLVQTPYCPACGEHASVEKGFCEFCGQPFKKSKDRREPNIEVTMERDGHAYKITQVGGYLTLWYEMDGRPIKHVLNMERKTRGQLKVLLGKWVARKYRK